MSWQAVEWALYQCPMLLTDKGHPDTTARQVLAILAEHANDHGANARPSVLRVRYATGLDERTIERALRRLERGGLIARCGVSRDGVVVWKLDLSLRRPESDWEQMQAEADERRREESERRKARRHRQSSAMSGTQNPGHEEVSGTESAGRPARRMPESGTQSADVRHAAPPEPPMNLPNNHPSTAPGGTLPPDPLRPQDPPSSGLGTEQDQHISIVGQLHGDQQGDHRSRARTYARARPPSTDHDRLPDATPTASGRAPARCEHGLAVAVRADGSLACPMCRRALPAAGPPEPGERLADVIPFRVRKVTA